VNSEFLISPSPLLPVKCSQPGHVSLQSVLKHGCCCKLEGVMHDAGASIGSGLLDTAAAVSAVPLKPNTESVGAFSSDFGMLSMCCRCLPARSTQILRSVIPGITSAGNADLPEPQTAYVILLHQKPLSG